MSTVALATLGCRLNQVDSQELAASLARRGLRTVGFDEPADVVVVNTCTVTGRAEVSDRQMIRRARRQHPRARIVVTGCWAQTDPGSVAAVPGVDAVVGNADKARLPDIVVSLLSGERPLDPRIEVSDIGAVRRLAATGPVAPMPGRSRAFLKAQEGCQHRCAFCIVPLARGVSRSLPAGLVIAQARALIEAGHPEIVLTGVDLGHYGADLEPRTSLAALVRALGSLPGLEWLRLSSVLPAYFTRELLDAVTTSAVVAPHLHIPLQSGSDRVLRRMRRPYNVAMYRALIERLAAGIPNLGLGADVIVGFPGETDVDFDETVRLVETLPFSYLHVFGYSDRQGTEAAGLCDRVPVSVVAQRSRVLRGMAEAKSRAFRRRLVGRVEPVLVLEARDRATGHLVGLTGNYVEVTFEGPDALMRTIAPVRVTAADAAGARGMVAPPEGGGPGEG